MSMLVSLAGWSFAQPNPKMALLTTRLDKIYAQKITKQLKPYYANPATADACEAWHSCTVWAFNQYTKDPAFKVIKAQLKTVRKVYRHRMARETNLFVEAFYKNRTIYVEFTTPYITPRIRSYNYIGKFPQ